jgi:hypothetical protein
MPVAGQLFFKWIKQHLRIKSSTALRRTPSKHKSGSLSPFVLVAIVKRQLNLSASLYEVLQILSLTMFERIPLDQLLNKVIPGHDQTFSIIN